MVLILNTVRRQKLFYRPAAKSTRIGIDLYFHPIPLAALPVASVKRPYGRCQQLLNKRQDFCITVKADLAIVLGTELIPSSG